MPSSSSPFLGSSLYSETGEYLSGSILRHLDISRSSAGLTFTQVAPYIDDIYVYSFTAKILFDGPIQPVKIVNSKFQNTGGIAIFGLVGSTPPVSAVALTFKNNIFLETKGSFPAIYGSFLATPCMVAYSFLIEDNTFQSNADRSVVVSRNINSVVITPTLTIVNSKFLSNSGYAVDSAGIHINVTNSVFTDNSARAISFNSDMGATVYIKGNSFVNNGDRAVFTQYPGTTQWYSGEISGNTFHSKLLNSCSSNSSSSNSSSSNRCHLSCSYPNTSSCNNCWFFEKKRFKYYCS